MDPADAFVKLYDRLSMTNIETLSDWSATEEIQETAKEVCVEVERTGQLSEEWMPPVLTDEPTLFAVLLGLDLALLHANRETSALGIHTLDELQTRLEDTGRLNKDTSGILLFRRSGISSCRPRDDAEKLDDFLHLIRLSLPNSDGIQLRFLPALYDLPEPELIAEAAEPEPASPLIIAQLPFLAEAGDVRWTPHDEAAVRFYNVAPHSERLGRYLRRALEVLDDSGAVLAILPEASLDDDLVEQWCELLSNTPRPEGSVLTWLLIGTGPVTSVGPTFGVRRPPNRAVLVRRNGIELLTQDKLNGFSFTVMKQEEYGVDFGDDEPVKRDEWISHDRTMFFLESRRGRFGVQVCEDFDRPDRRYQITAAGVTHLIVPVLAAAMWDGGWQAKAGEQLGIDAGVRAAVSNGLAIQRFYGDKPVPTLLTVTLPTERPEEYLRTEDLINCYSNADGVAMSARDDALTPRVAPW